MNAFEAVDRYNELCRFLDARGRRWRRLIARGDATKQDAHREMDPMAQEAVVLADTLTFHEIVQEKIDRRKAVC
jgi:hypothetical protein